MKKNNKGFTLLELLAVLIILAALSTIAIAIFGNKAEEAKTTAHATNIQEILKMAQSYEWQAGEDPELYGELNEEHPLVKKGIIKDPLVNPWK